MVQNKFIEWMYILHKKDDHKTKDAHKMNNYNAKDYMSTLKSVTVYSGTSDGGRPKKRMTGSKQRTSCS